MKNILNDVSETALITLRSRVSASRMENPIIQDEMGEQVLRKNQSINPGGDSRAAAGQQSSRNADKPHRHQGA